MFSSFRDKFRAVQNDVLLGLQRLTGPGPTSPERPADCDVSCLAGARLLSHHQHQWSQLHTGAERAALRADEVNASLLVVRERCRREHAVMTDLHARLTTLPQLTDKVRAMATAVSSLHDELSWTELQLLELEHQAAQAALDDRKTRERAKLAAYRQARQQQLEDTQCEDVRAAREHLERSQQHEQRRLLEQAERHSTFDRLAHDQMEHFRRHHSLEGAVQVSAQGGPRLSLDEVDIRHEVGDAALDAFLADVELDPEDPARDQHPDDREDRKIDLCQEPGTGL